MSGPTVFMAFGGGLEEAPRLTTMLRTFATEHGADFNLDEAFLKRQKTIQARRKRLKGMESRKQLAEQLFGPWDKTPRPAKEAYNVFMKAVADMVCGVASPDEVQEYAWAAWRACETMAVKKKAKSGKSQASIRSIRDALAATFEYVDDDQLQKIVAAYYSLQESQSMQSHDAKEMARDKTVDVQKKPEVMEHAFGNDITFGPQVDMSRDEAVLAMCGIDSELVGPGIDRQPSGAPLSANDLLVSFSKAPNFPQQDLAPVWEDDEDSDDGKGTKQKVSLSWLQLWMERMGALTGHDDDEELVLSICRTVLTSESGDQLVEELCGLLGLEALELVEEVVQNRLDLCKLISSAISKGRKALDKFGPSHSKSFTIMSEYEKQSQKLERKARRKKGGPTDDDVDWLMRAGFSGLLEAGGELKAFDAPGAGGGAGRTRLALPDHKRRTGEGYEEYLIPARRPEPVSEKEKTVYINELEDWAQLAFQGYKSLNRIQSRIFPTAYHSNENLLVCAPTGAGKTNIAMITVLREISLNMKYEVIQKGDFKIVYVAPMKALASEMTATFGKRLAPLGLTVKELTGDMQLSKKELAATQMIVTTPEKWDVITRKGGDVSVASLVKLLIIDEVHLLNDDRGPVIETLVARTLRQVEVSQSMIRIVGLSATLPNYEDVAEFLSVNKKSGLFYFDQSYRPVPLALQFVGVSEKEIVKRNKVMLDVCYQKVVTALKNGKQAMVFVHSRKDTGNTARALVDRAQKESEMDLFLSENNPQYSQAKKAVFKSRNREVTELFPSGFGIHHAGMLRSDRNIMEKNFSSGVTRVLCCTATLAWGVNLPAHTVIIKGTQVYDPQKGGFKDLGMLDVQQIFGRAGRPQFDTSGEGIIITSHDRLSHYLGMLTHQTPIESQFQKGLVDHLNAEIVLGTVTNLREACTWLSYTYLFVRMIKNPLAYQVGEDDKMHDPRLDEKRLELITNAALELDRARMVRLAKDSGQLYVTEKGRVASHFYIKHATILVFNEMLEEQMGQFQLLDMLSRSSEFESMAVREEEREELQGLADLTPYKHKYIQGVNEERDKANVLMQSFISRKSPEAFSLVADVMYVANNAPRICRAVFEICIRHGWKTVAMGVLDMCKAFELQMWPNAHPLYQFRDIQPSIVNKINHARVGLDELYDMDEKEIGRVAQNALAGQVVYECLRLFPHLELNAKLHPITRTVLQVHVEIVAAFKWKDKTHGGALQWFVMVEDLENDRIYHNETFLLTKAMMKEDSHKITFAIPIHDPIPSQYVIHAVNDKWMQCETTLPLPLQSVVLPQIEAAHTDLLDLTPLPVGVLRNPAYESLLKFKYFNAIQTQAFHTLYHTDRNVLLGAPTGSGKTISAELGMLRVFEKYPDHKVIYIAPLKALVRERLDDWGKGLCPRLNKKMVELTGDFTPDIRSLTAADIIIATPEKWDGISRNWQTRSYVRQVRLLIFDEIHLLGSDRGPIIEVIVSRMRYIASQIKTDVRFMGLSTALANAHDVADWMGVEQEGLFNFRPTVRPVRLEARIQGYSGKFYCPRMATMNKPSYAAIQTHSPTKPVIVFVSSRRQTRLTALDLIAFAAADQRPQQWVHMDQEDLEDMIHVAKDPNLKHTLQFGIGMHHAGLCEQDRTIVETLFVEQKIQVLVATSTLAWGVNTPAHLVIIKGTEYFDPKTRRYVDFPITDALQMMGRAGRPQYDKSGVAVIMVHEPKKAFYKKFLYEPFPVESSLPEHLADHMNAEIVGGTISSKQDALNYLTWTYFYRRLLQNPSFYELDDTEKPNVSHFLSNLVEKTMESLRKGGCIAVNEDDSVEPLTMGRIAAFFYLKHHTMSIFNANLTPDLDFKSALQVLCHAAEYDELPVRHNEDKLNAALAQQVRWSVDQDTMSSPNTKSNLLLQAHMARLPLPISDYVTDTKTVLDNSLRVLQALVDICADAGWLATAITVMNLVQSVIQARWIDESSLLTIPHLNGECIDMLKAGGVECLPQLMDAVSSKPAWVSGLLVPKLGGHAAKQVLQVVRRLPIVTVKPKPLRFVNPPKKDRGTNTKDLSDPSAKQVLIEVEIFCKRAERRNLGNSIAFAPRFPKVKEEGWWLVAGDCTSRELYALKRLSVRDGQKSVARLRCPVTNIPRSVQKISVFLVADSYIGLDQQYEIEFPWHQLSM